MWLLNNRLHFSLCVCTVINHRCIDPKWPTSCRSDLHLNSETCQPAMVVKNPHLCSNPSQTQTENTVSISYYIFHHGNIWDVVSETLFFKIWRCLPPSVLGSPLWWSMIRQGDQHCLHFVTACKEQKVWTYRSNVIL